MIEWRRIVYGMYIFMCMCIWWLHLFHDTVFSHLTMLICDFSILCMTGRELNRTDLYVTPINSQHEIHMNVMHRQNLLTKKNSKKARRIRYFITIDHDIWVWHGYMDPLASILTMICHRAERWYPKVNAADADIQKNHSRSIAIISNLDRNIAVWR